LQALHAIKARLYSDSPLSGDERRDIANALDAILSKIETAEISDIISKKT
jgi:hypothetical protein